MNAQKRRSENKIRRACSLAKEGHGMRALQEISSALQKDQENVELRYWNAILSTMLIVTGGVTGEEVAQRAEDACNWLIARKEKIATAHLSLAQVAFARKKFGTACVNFRLALTHFDDTPLFEKARMRALLAKAEIARGHKSIAREELERALEEFGAMKDGYVDDVKIMLTKIYIEFGLYDEAAKLKGPPPPEPASFKN